MEIIISARHHIELDEGVKRYIEEHVQKLTVNYPKLTTARVVIEDVRNWRIVEAHLSGKHLNIDAHGKSDDLYIAIDSALDKLERQLKKYVDRIQDHHAPKMSELEVAAVAEEASEAEEEKI